MSELNDTKISHRFLTVKVLSKELDGIFSESSLRYHIFHADKNGLSQHIRRIGKKVLISFEGFQSWINNNGGKV